MKKYLGILIVFFLLLLQLACKEQSNFISEEKDVQADVQKENIDGNANDFFPTSTTNQIIHHNYYTLSYHEEHEQAEWVAYQLQPNSSSTTDFKRPYFVEDPKVQTASADWRNYRNSGYDKGHLCPAGDMKFSKQAYDDTFYTSNISPQKPDFNAGVWNRLEQKVRYWADKYDGLFVVTGGVLEPNLKTIGKEEVSVPNAFYKVLLRNTDDKFQAIAFLVPHENSEQPLYSFVVSIDELEKRTGIDFFHQLPDDVEKKIEESKDYKEWSFK